MTGKQTGQGPHGDEERVVGVGDERSRSASLDRGVDDRLGSGVPGGLIVAPLPGVGVVHVALI